MAKRGSEEEKKRRNEEGEKISLRFPQTFEAATLFSIHFNCKRGLLAWLIQERKPLYGAYAPSTAPLAEGFDDFMRVWYDYDVKQENNEHMLDVIIVGGGPIGLACGIEAEKRNLSYRILEKGCLINSIYNFPVNMTFFSTSERLEIGGVPFISHGDKPTRREALEYFRRVTGTWNLKINTYERVTDIHKKNTHYNITTEKNVYHAMFVIIATGYYDNPNLMNIPGENLEKVTHYFKEAHPYAYQRVIVVGGGNSAVDVALECYRRGAEVTVVVREPQLLRNVKYWVKPDIENRIKEGSIKAFFNAALREIREKEVDIETKSGLITIENDFVFAMTGYHPDFDFLKKAGIKFGNDDECVPCFNADTFETNMKGIYLAGVVCGGMNTSKWFIENAREHPRAIFEHIIKQKEIQPQRH